MSTAHPPPHPTGPSPSPASLAGTGRWHPPLCGPSAQAAVGAVREILAALRPAASGAPGRFGALGPDVASGAAGVALAFFHAARALGEPAWGDDAAALLEQAAGALESREMSASLYAGFTGVAWAVAHLGHLGFPPALEYDLSAVDRALLDVLSAPAPPPAFDLVTGVAGIGVYALERLDAPIGWTLLERAVVQLERRARRMPEGMAWFTPADQLNPALRGAYPDGWYNLGVAHGTPGAAAFLAHAHAAGVARAAPLLEGAVRWMLARRLPHGARSRFPDLWVPGREPGPARTAWCYGDPGVAAALLLAARAAARPEWEAAAAEAALAAAARAEEDTGVRDAPLCHGSLGVAHLFGRLHHATGLPALGDAARRWAEHALRGEPGGDPLARFALLDGAAGAWAPRLRPGLLDGVAGAALALLGLATPHEPAWDRLFLCDLEPAPRPRGVPAAEPSPRPRARAGRPARGGAEMRTAGVFVARTPLLPFDAFLAWGRGVQAPAAGADGPALERALAADRAVLTVRLRELAALPEVREALYVASPELWEGLQAWEEAPGSGRGERAGRALVRYVSRMAGRPTPFGLFAGCTTGGEGETSELRLGPRAGYRRHTRLDMDYLAALADALRGDPALRDALRYTPNTSLYAAGGRLHLVEARPAGDGRSHHLVALDASPHLGAALERARGGATLGQVAEALADGEVEMEEALEFARELADAQVLVSALEPAVTGDEPVHGMAAELARAGHPAGAALDRARDLLRCADAAGVGSGGAWYPAVGRALEPLPVRARPGRLFQVDLYKDPVAATLGPAVRHELERGADLLFRLAGRGDDPLSGFRAAFTERWERQEVPLAAALDEEVGIGFPPPLAPPADPGAAERRRFLLERLLEHARTGAPELVLEEDDLRRLEPPGPVRLPPGASLMASLSASSAAAADAGDFRLLLLGVTGPSGGALLGRFCHGDARLEDAVRGLLAREEALTPGAVTAEVVHLPAGRLGNVLCRPVLAGFEIPYLARGGAPPERQLRVDDLRVSVDDGRVVLRSTRLGCEVRPRLTTAHAHARPGNLPLYRFLCALPRQDARGASWDWGMLSGAPFLPRVRTGRLVLARATWRVDRAQAEGVAAPAAAARWRAVQRLRGDRGLPRLVVVAEGDYHLPVDLDNALSVEVLAELLRKRGTLQLTELYPPPGELWAEGPEGRFTHELVVPLLRARPSPPAPAPPPTRAVHPRRRTFPPGSEWLYLKVFAGPAALDRILAEVVAPAARRAVREGAADRWFFVRYPDPAPHLRVRLHGHPARLGGQAGPALMAALADAVEAGVATRVQVDTYQREVERYGGLAAMEAAEALFHADSEAAAEVVRACPGDAGADARQRLALLGVHLLLDDFGMDEAARRALLERAGAGSGNERRAWGAHWRAVRAEVEALLSGAPEGAALAAGAEALRARSRAAAPAVAELLRLEREGALDEPLERLLLHYTHMHLNRLLREDAPRHERRCYHVLARHYASRLARSPEPRSADGGG